MLRRFKVIAILTAWLLATGAQWDLMQLVAWTQMFAGYSEGMTFTAAAEKTFSGEMCGLCHLVQDGRKQQESNGEKLPHGKASGKMPDVCPLVVTALVFTPHREQVGTIAAVEKREGRGRARPPTQPPRA